MVVYVLNGSAPRLSDRDIGALSQYRLVLTQEKQYKIVTNAPRVYKATSNIKQTDLLHK